MSTLVLVSCDAGVTEPRALAAPEGPNRLLAATTVTPVFRDGFETGARAAAQNGYQLRGAQAKTGDAVLVTREKARTGSYSLKFKFGADSRLCDDSWAEQRFQLGENLTEVWFEYYVYFLKGTEGLGAKYLHRQPTTRGLNNTCTTKADVSTNNKFFAMWDTIYDRADGGDVRVFLETRRSTTSASGDSYLYGLWGTDTRTAGAYNWPGGRWDPAITDANRGRWMQVRIHAKLADTKLAANGMLQVWVDGVLRVNMQNLDLAPAAGGSRFFREGYLMGWSNSGFSQTTAMYMDDISIYKTNPGW